MSAPLFPTTRNLFTTAAGDREGTVRITGLMGYLELVAELGVNPKRLLKRCGLDPQIFNNSENVIPFGVSSRLLALAAVETRCPHFGLLLGQRRNIASAGPVGFLVQNSPTVEVALRNLIRYLHLQVAGSTCALLVQRAEAFFTINIDLHGIVGAEQVLDIAAADIFMFMRIICQRNWLPSAVHYAHRPPADIAPYQALFRAPVLFDQEITALRFPAYWLKHTVPNADPNLCNFMQSYVSRIEQQYEGDFSGQIRSVLRSMLPTGKCTAERLADLFSMNRRTLHRRLTANGTTFETMVDDERHIIASRNLADTNVSINRLAAMLGYRDTSSFIRAFRRWTRATPTEWRAQHRS